mmetsp:Transcript_88210/g.108021  ORF Transcript_88210/g.108021 Transcript_88210/m.108021 type:complete len:228 (-) Transcript_88210:151-834(-)
MAKMVKQKKGTSLPNKEFINEAQNIIDGYLSDGSLEITLNLIKATILYPSYKALEFEQQELLLLLNESLTFMCNAAKNQNIESMDLAYKLDYFWRYILNDDTMIFDEDIFKNLISKTAKKKKVNDDVDSLEMWLEKKSKHIGVWRNRYCVLKDGIMKTYKDNKLKDCTESINVQIISNIGVYKDDETQFGITYKKDIFIFKASSKSDRDKWINALTISKKIMEGTHN